jgi:hypothetical protein
VGRPAFPKSGQVQEALLLFLLEHGGDTGLWARDTYAPLADFFDLGMKERICTRDHYHESYWHKWVQSSRQALVKSGDLHPPNFDLGLGLWRLTEQGKWRATQIAARISRPVFAAYSIPPVSRICLKEELTWDDLVNIGADRLLRRHSKKLAV